MTEIVPRHVSPLLATAIFAVPLVFTWFLVRRGYAASTRNAGFLWLAVHVLAGVSYVVFSG